MGALLRSLARKGSERNFDYISQRKARKTIMMPSKEKMTTLPIVGHTFAYAYHLSLNEQARRNKERFPEDFMFRLTKEEFLALRSQFATSRWGGRRYPPNAFTEHGAVMLPGVLNSPGAVDASIQVVRAFVRLLEILLSNKDLSQKLQALEKQYNKQFKVVFEAIRQLMDPVSSKQNSKIGFR